MSLFTAPPTLNAPLVRNHHVAMMQPQGVGGQKRKDMRLKYTMRLVSLAACYNTDTLRLIVLPLQTTVNFQ